MDWNDFPVSVPELTTVTKRPRRIFSWSRNQYRDALYKTLPSIVFLNFINYFRSVNEFNTRLAEMQEDHDMVGLKPMLLYGLGPKIDDVYESVDRARDALTSMVEGRTVSENQAV